MMFFRSFSSSHNSANSPFRNNKNDAATDSPSQFTTRQTELIRQLEVALGRAKEETLQLQKIKDNDEASLRVEIAKLRSELNQRSNAVVNSQKTNHDVQAIASNRMREFQQLQLEHNELQQSHRKLLLLLSQKEKELVDPAAAETEQMLRDWVKALKRELQHHREKEIDTETDETPIEHQQAEHTDNINYHHHHNNHVHSQLLKELKVEKELNTKHEMKLVELRKELAHAQQEAKALTNKLEELEAAGSETKALRSVNNQLQVEARKIKMQQVVTQAKLSKTESELSEAYNTLEKLRLEISSEYHKAQIAESAKEEASSKLQQWQLKANARKDKIGSLKSKVGDLVKQLNIRDEIKQAEAVAQRNLEIAIRCDNERRTAQVQFTKKLGGVSTTMVCARVKRPRNIEKRDATAIQVWETTSKVRTLVPIPASSMDSSQMPEDNAIINGHQIHEFQMHQVVGKGIPLVALYSDTLRHLVISAMDGSHLCFVAYGPKYSGKTFTCFNDDAVVDGLKQWHDRGLVPLAMDDVFKLAESRKQFQHTEVYFAISYICNDTIGSFYSPEQVLIHDSNQALVMICDYFKGLTKFERLSNSKGHTLATITIKSTIRVTNESFCGRLHVVDLGCTNDAQIPATRSQPQLQLSSQFESKEVAAMKTLLLHQKVSLGASVLTDKIMVGATKSVLKCVLMICVSALASEVEASFQSLQFSSNFGMKMDIISGAPGNRLMTPSDKYKDDSIRKRILDAENDVRKYQSLCEQKTQQLHNLQKKVDVCEEFEEGVSNVVDSILKTIAPTYIEMQQMEKRNQQQSMRKPISLYPLKQRQDQILEKLRVAILAKEMYAEEQRTVTFRNTGIGSRLLLSPRTPCSYDVYRKPHSARPRTEGGNSGGGNGSNCAGLRSRRVVHTARSTSQKTSDSSISYENDPFPPPPPPSFALKSPQKP